MLGELIGFVALVALALFILWEGWNRRASASKPLLRSVMDRGVVPGLTNQESVLFVGSGVLVLFGLVLLEALPEPPFKGRGALFTEFVYATFGPYGLPGLLWLLAIAALGGGIAVRRRRLSSRA